MDKKTVIVMGLLGAGPAMGMPAQGSAIEYRAYSVHARTVEIVQELISSKALYASADATRLLIRRAALDAETISGLESSNEVSVDSDSGDFVVKPEFAVALLKARAFEGFLPQSIADFVMLQQLQKDASGEVSVELAGFHWAPFF